jgi:hypothetical protein
MDTAASNTHGLSYLSPYCRWLATVLQDILVPLLSDFFRKSVYTQALAEADRLYKQKLHHHQHHPAQSLDPNNNNTSANNRISPYSQEYDEVFYPQALLPLLERLHLGAAAPSIVAPPNASMEQQQQHQQARTEESRAIGLAFESLRQHCEAQYPRIGNLVKEIYGNSLNDFLTYKGFAASYSEPQQVPLDFGEFLRICIRNAAGEFRKSPVILDVRCPLPVIGERRAKLEEKLYVCIQRALTSLLPYDYLITQCKPGGTNSSNTSSNNTSGNTATKRSNTNATTGNNNSNNNNSNNNNNHNSTAAVTLEPVTAMPMPSPDRYQYDAKQQYTNNNNNNLSSIVTASGLLSEFAMHEPDQLRQTVLPRKLPFPHTSSPTTTASNNNTNNHNFNHNNNNNNNNNTFTGEAQQPHSTNGGYPVAVLEETQRLQEQLEAQKQLIQEQNQLFVSLRQDLHKAQTQREEYQQLMQREMTNREVQNQRLLEEMRKQLLQQKQQQQTPVVPQSSSSTTTQPSYYTSSPLFGNNVMPSATKVTAAATKSYPQQQNSYSPQPPQIPPKTVQYKPNTQSSTQTASISNNSHSSSMLYRPTFVTRSNEQSQNEAAPTTQQQQHTATYVPQIFNTGTGNPWQVEGEVAPISSVNLSTAPPPNEQHQDAPQQQPSIGSDKSYMALRQTKSDFVDQEQTMVFDGQYSSTLPLDALGLTFAMPPYETNSNNIGINSNNNTNTSNNTDNDGVDNNTARNEQHLDHYQTTDEHSASATYTEPSAIPVATEEQDEEEKEEEKSHLPGMPQMLEPKQQNAIAKHDDDPFAFEDEEMPNQNDNNHNNTEVAEQIQQQQQQTEAQAEVNH